MENSIVIGKQEYPIKEKYINQKDLKFYAENPRIYSILNNVSANPSQEEIEDTLTEMEHVKQLVVAIKANDGLIDPLIVKDNDMTVLEGNSRLAAYRILAKSNPVKWANVKCRVLPHEISDKAIFTLLGQYHIIGRKDWNPYEQAGYLYRRVKSTNVDIDIIAKELGLSLPTAKSYYRNYEFMLSKNDLKSSHWSHYDEYLKNQNIKKYRDTNADLDETISEAIKNDKIAKAVDIRDILGGIAKVNSKTSKKIMAKVAAGEISIYEGFERVEDTGKTGHAYQALKKFRDKISEKSFEKDLEKSDIGTVRFELKRIHQKIETLLKKYEN